MARPRSDDRRNAIVSAAVRVVAAQGLSAATALIAKEAGVSNGSLFTYFETKADLFNQLYRDLKTEMAVAALGTDAVQVNLRERMYHVWVQWLRWAVSHPDKRRTLAHLNVSEDITPATRVIGNQAMTQIAVLLEQAREHGPMRDASPALMLGLMSAVAEATTDIMVREPSHAEQHCAVAFDAFWRMIACSNKETHNGRDSIGHGGNRVDRQLVDRGAAQEGV